MSIERLKQEFGDSEDWNDEVKEQIFSVSSFLLKHVFFWTAEEVFQTEWRLNNLYRCVCHVLRKFDEFLQDNYIPHFFFGYTKNLLAGDIHVKEADLRKMRAKCQMMRRNITDLRENMLKALIQLPRLEHLDHQWTWSKNGLARTTYFL